VLAGGEGREQLLHAEDDPMSNALLRRRAAEALDWASDTSDLNERARLFMLAAWFHQLADENEAVATAAGQETAGSGTPASA
jgi:hypothetical protein